MLFIYQGQETIYPPRLVLRRCGRAVIAAGPPVAILRAAFLLPWVSADSAAVFLVSAARMAAAKLIFGCGAESSILVVDLFSSRRSSVSFVFCFVSIC
jgi:hypothetical protein